MPQLPRKGQVIILKTKKHVKKVTGNFDPPGSLLSGPRESLHPLNFLPGSHQPPETAELRKEKSQKVCISPNPPNRKTDLLNMAPLSKHSQRDIQSNSRADWSLLNEEDLQGIALGINASQWPVLVQKHRPTRPLLCSKVPDKKEKYKHLPWTSRHSIICLKHIFPALVSSNHHPLSVGHIH